MNLSSFNQKGGSGLFMRERRFFFDCNNVYAWTVPDGVTKIFAFAIGAGGGGSLHRQSNNAFNDTKCAEGGGGGGYASGVIAVTPGATINVTIGKGGNGVAFQVGGSTAGGTTSFGSYLTANGGAAGANTNSGSYNANDSYGTNGGGTASTSGVTQAYTATGGGNSIPGNSTTASTNCGAGGGGSSGSPWGPGSNKQIFNPRSCMGGAGWGTGLMKTMEYRGRSYSTAWDRQMFAVTGGDGSHSPAMITCSTNYDGTGMGCSRGGNGLTAKGGGIYYSGGVQLSEATSSAVANQMDTNGEGKDWWFPWDIDGGGGGGVAHWSQGSSDSRFHYVAIGGDGGPGAGGGAAWVDRSQNKPHSCQGGKGGLGGGGGGAIGYGAHGSSQDVLGGRGGDGGIGGGGGGVMAYTTQAGSTWYEGAAGWGGNGMVGVYW